MQMLTNVAIARLAKVRAASSRPTSPGCRRGYFRVQGQKDLLLRAIPLAPNIKL
jgi:hypothetical protein